MHIFDGTIVPLLFHNVVEVWSGQFCDSYLPCVKLKVLKMQRRISLYQQHQTCFSYLSKKKKHHLFIAPTVCTYTTEICPKTDGEGVAPSCSYKFPNPGMIAC